MNGNLRPFYGSKEELVSVHYRCHLPFTLIGSQQRICLPNSTWSGTVPMCVKGKLHFPPIGTWFLCLMFFRFKTHTIICLCLKHIIHAGRTSRVRCAPPSKLLNGYHRPARDTAGGEETIGFFCKNSYILIGNHQSTCLSNGSWSSRPPRCLRGSCFQTLGLGIKCYIPKVAYFPHHYNVRTVQHVSNMLEVVCLSDSLIPGKPHFPE